MPAATRKTAKARPVGRARNEAFFFKMYGASAAEVQRKLVPVVWLPKHLNQRIMVTSVNGINQKLQAVSDELDKLPDEYIKYLQNPGGTFNWRPIVNTDRMSAHSYGIAIDVVVSKSNYWEWEKQNGQIVWHNQIPQAIVDAFEAEGFAWGGRWYHYDTMHFEYRPELAAASCAPHRKT